MEDNEFFCYRVFNYVVKRMFDVLNNMFLNVWDVMGWFMICVMIVILVGEFVCWIMFLGLFVV